MTTALDPEATGDSASRDGDLAAARLMDMIAAEEASLATLAAEAAARQRELERLAEMVRPSSADGLERLPDGEALRAWLVRHAATAREEVLTFAPGASPPPGALEGARDLDLQALARGVRIRTLYLTSAVRNAHVRRHVEVLEQHGAQYRTVASLPLRMIVVDRRAALLPVDLQDSSSGALVVEDPATLAVLIHLFEVVWDSSEPIAHRRVAPERGDTPTPQQQQVLRMLAEGATDAEVAQALDISPRTVRRITTELFGRLDAVSRFQAGARAFHAGWLR